MRGQAIDPMSSRFWFKMRTPLNFALASATCAVLVGALSLIIPFWAADIIAIAVVLYLFFTFLDKRALKIRCDHCERIVLSNTPWVCGFCGEKNEKPDDFSFLNRCEHCSAQPKAYKCHYSKCQQLIHFTTDQSDENFAYCLNTRHVVTTQSEHRIRGEEKKATDHAIEMAERQAKLDELTRKRERELARSERLQSLDDEIRAAELEAKLISLRRQRESMAPKTIKEQKQAGLDRAYDAALGSHEAAEKKRAEARERYKNDPEGLKRALEAIDHWLEGER